MNLPPGPICRYKNEHVDYGIPLERGEPPGPVGVRPPRALDELTPIARWMVQEMRRNAAGEHVERIRRLNNYSPDTCLAETREWPRWLQLLNGPHWQKACLDQATSTKLAAFMAWTQLVGQNGPWDHKPIIARIFTPAVESGEQHWHRYHGYVYFYDVWSNVHYGYVGRACGFSESELLDGAGLEQIGSDLARLRLPKLKSGTGGLRRFDGRSDRVAVELGIHLYSLPGASLNAHQMILSILSRGHLLERGVYLP